MAARALHRFRFSPQEINTIVFLIRNHLAMSSVIFRRDLEDKEVVSRFANLTGDPEQLRLLTLLTFADIKAVAPGVLNDWKKDLLWQLYVATYRNLTLEFGEERIEEEDIGEKLLKGLDPASDRDSFERFLEGFPIRYLRSTKPDEIYHHYRMATQLDSEHPIQTRILNRKTHSELCVITPDQSRLFSTIVGLLSYFEMNILKGYGFANRRHTILDFFQFLDVKGSFRHARERSRFQNLLGKAISGKVSVDRLLKSKESSVLLKKSAPRFAPSVYFEDEESDRYTIMEIVAPDALGLLYRISREIAKLECDIELALISTEGEKAVDVFYLCYKGSRLPPELNRKLAEQIAKVSA
jgi:[protein-PII] uridylyltransferase